MPYYRVHTWDHERGQWCCVVVSCRRWTLRTVLRRLYSLGWDDPSILVVRLTRDREEFNDH